MTEERKGHIQKESEPPHGIKVIALDVEGTLISNAMSQFPRPGLKFFLEQCQQRASRVVIFTAISHRRFEALARTLVHEGSAPPWFATLEFIEWSGPHKDLRFVPGVTPQQVVLVDDLEQYVAPGQHAQWVKAPAFEAPYSPQDRGLWQVLDAFDRLGLYNAPSK